MTMPFLKSVFFLFRILDVCNCSRIFTIQEYFLKHIKSFLKIFYLEKWIPEPPPVKKKRKAVKSSLLAGFGASSIKMEDDSDDEVGFYFHAFHPKYRCFELVNCAATREDQHTYTNPTPYTSHCPYPLHITLPLPHTLRYPYPLTPYVSPTLTPYVSPTP